MVPVTQRIFCKWVRFAPWAVLLVAIGCGSKDQAIVTGTVTLNDQPLQNGTITFLPADGATASAAGVITDGKYRVEMPPGEKRVLISAMQVVGQRQVYEGDPDSPVVDEVREMIPPQYNAASTLTVDVQAGNHKQDFNLR
jgi:hypothetical protein